MKLTRRSFVGKVPFGIAGLLALLRGWPSEWHIEGDQYVGEPNPVELESDDLYTEAGAPLIMWFYSTEVVWTTVDGGMTWEIIDVA